MKNPNVIRALRLTQVSEITGLSKTQIYRLIKRGQFPVPAKLSARVVAWEERTVDKWLADRFATVGATNA